MLKGIDVSTYQGKVNWEKVKKQMADTFKELDRACGDGADYLVRPPYGSTNQKVRDAIDAPLIYWSVDSEDWSLLNAEKVRKKIGDAYLRATHRQSRPPTTRRNCKA